jgi:hypothetical protein
LAEELLRPNTRRLLPSDALIRAYAEIVQEQKHSLMRRVVGYARVHPVKTTGYATALAAALVLGFLAVRPVKDTNPAYAAVKNYQLFVYNSNHEVLWTKTAKGIPNTKLDQPASASLIENRQVYLVDDIDDDSRNEVLISGISNEKGQSFTLDSLYCFNSNGSLRWVQAYYSNAFAESFEYTRSGQWNIRHFFVMKRTESSQPRLFVVAYCAPYFPAKISEVNPTHGQELRTYWHPGGISRIIPHDIDNDGRQEIVATGVNNGHGKAYILALDPDRLEGCGPAPSEFYPRGIPKAKEKIYMLLPRTDISEKYSTSGYSTPDAILVMPDGNLIVYVQELDGVFPDQPNANILFTIGPNLRILSVTWSDQFLRIYDRLLSEGKVKKPLSPEYWENLKKGALYWDGEKFVKEPTMNKLYPDSKNMP